MADPVSYDECEGIVDSLYTLRDTYYQKYPTANVETRTRHIEEETTKALEKMEQTISQCTTVKEKDKILYLKAKLLNMAHTLHSESEDILTRHLKFHPFHLEAWNLLGEHYWKKSDMESSKNCFFKALEICRNSTSLRCLSMLYRSLNGSDEEVAGYLAESLRFAQEAVSLDVNDGRNWYVLGNVHIALYFKIDQDPAHLKQSLKAYTNASRHENIYHNPDFHFNRAVVYNFDGNYEQALISYDMASTCDPNWSDPKNCLENLEKFLSNFQESIATRGKITSRKLRDILKTLKPSDIGLYAKGMTKRVGGKLVKVPLNVCSLSSLVLGPNPNKVVLGKVVCQIYAPDALTFAFCILENDGPCYAVNVYNIAEGRGVKIGDSVAIPEPLVCVVDFKFKDKVYKFQWIRVDNPLLMVVNGKPMHPDNRAIPLLKTVFSPES